MVKSCSTCQKFARWFVENGRLCWLSMLFQLHLGHLILVDQDRQGGLYQPWRVEY